MELHEDKFELIVHRHAPQSYLLNEFPFPFDCMIYTGSSGDVLLPTEHLKDLGVNISSDLSWSRHVNTIASRARGVASWAFSAFKALDRLTMLTLYKSLVRSHLEYCCPL